jgi:exopolysaccharide biosynthesis protein
MTRGATVPDTGYVFKALGADYALNLDGGGSSALYFGGYKVGPGRNLPNAIVFTP